MSTEATEVKTLVVKLGGSLITGPTGFDGRVMENVVKEVAALKQERAVNVLIVSSGAIGCGMTVLGIKERPRLLPLKQATAAVGQSRLMHYYETLFQTYGNGLKIAQVLLSASELDRRATYLNIRNTIRTLFDMKQVVPIVNENDSVATEELRFGDNDTLAARVAAKIDADMLIILSDVDGLFDKNPAQHPDARLLTRVELVTPEIERLAGDTHGLSTVGGMITKLAAAKIACSAGVRTVIANGNRDGIIRGVLDGAAAATTFEPAHAALSHRKRWIAFGHATRGIIQVDDGARAALLEKGRSLLAAGITQVSGEFEVGATVQIVDPGGRPIACGLTNYSSGDVQRIMGKKSAQIESILGRKDYDEVVHRNNLALV